VTTLSSSGSPKETRIGSECSSRAPLSRDERIYPFLAERINRMSSKLAFPQFAQLEQNLQISYHVQDSCESQTQHKMPAYSVVKDPCPRFDRGVPLPAERSLAFFFKRSRNNKKPGVERRAKPSAYTRTGSRDARLNAILSS